MSSYTQFDWAKFLVLAHSLASQGTEEASRSAISRAYYAAFGMAKLRLDQKGIMVPDTGEAHSFVWKSFSRYACRELGNTGTRLLRTRKQADYDGSLVNLGKVTESALADAEEILRLLTDKPNCP